MPTLSSTDAGAPRICGFDRPIILAAAYLLLYVALDWATDVRPAMAVGITPWNPQAGLTLVFLTRAGPAWLPVTALAVFLADGLIHRPPVSPALIVLAAVWIALVYGGLAMLLRRWHWAEPIARTPQAARLIGVATAASLIVATGYAGLFVAAGTLPSQQVLRAILRYWFGDLNGILMLTPLLLHYPQWRAAGAALRDYGREILLQMLAVLATLLVIFALPPEEQLRFFSLLFVPVIWIALRWSIPGAILAVAAVQTGLILAARAEIHTPRFIDMQFLMVTLSITALLLGAVVASRRRAEADLRERDKALAHATRFAVAGELAAALAHELNQPITALVSYVRAAEILARQGVRGDDRLPLTLGKAAQEALRASEVLRRLREFYRSNGVKREPIHVAHLCACVIRAHQERLTASGITLNVVLDPNLPQIEADSAHLEIVLHNLLANAIDAVASREDRRIQLRGAAAGGAVTICIEDSGPGIPQHVREKLFEPLFTTKPEGMGLGLAISRTLVRARHGELSCATSRELGGAAFAMMLPINFPQAPPATL